MKHTESTLLQKHKKMACTGGGTDAMVVPVLFHHPEPMVDSTVSESLSLTALGGVDPACRRGTSGTHRWSGRGRGRSFSASSEPSPGGSCLWWLVVRAGARGTGHTHLRGDSPRDARARIRSPHRNPFDNGWDGSRSIFLYESDEINNTGSRKNRKNSMPQYLNGINITSLAQGGGASSLPSEHQPRGEQWIRLMEGYIPAGSVSFHEPPSPSGTTISFWAPTPVADW